MRDWDAKKIIPIGFLKYWSIFIKFVSDKYDKDGPTQFNFVLRIKSELKRNYKLLNTFLVFSVYQK